MSFDYFAFLAETKACPKQMNETGLASGFVNECTVWSCRDKSKEHNKTDPKNVARQCYMQRAAAREIQLPGELHLEPNHASLPHASWFAMEVSFTLQSPWYSKDDRPFHVLDNPVRKDRVVGAPFMAAASWKGMLRWACRMQEDLFGHLEKHDNTKRDNTKRNNTMDGWKDPPWILHLFGNEKGATEGFRSGALAFYPTWFKKVGFEVINPHKRTTRAGTQPIYYEVVPAGQTGCLRLLYAPLPGEAERDGVKPDEVLAHLVASIQALLETYGISAKRTAGWGAAKIDTWKGFLKASDESAKVKPQPPKRCNSLQDLDTLVSKPDQAGSFTCKDAEEFKKVVKQRFARKEGDQ